MRTARKLEYIQGSNKNVKTFGWKRRIYIVVVEKRIENALVKTDGCDSSKWQEKTVTWCCWTSATLAVCAHGDVVTTGVISPDSFGYPDPTYLVRVTEELREKGITADWLTAWEWQTLPGLCASLSVLVLVVDMTWLQVALWDRPSITRMTEDKALGRRVSRCCGTVHITPIAVPPPLSLSLFSLSSGFGGAHCYTWKKILLSAVHSCITQSSVTFFAIGLISDALI